MQRLVLCPCSCAENWEAVSRRGWVVQSHQQREEQRQRVMEEAGQLQMSENQDSGGWLEMSRPWNGRDQPKLTQQ